jgi:hypothetical protein
MSKNILNINRQKRAYVRREDVEGSVVDELLESLLAARTEHQPLVPEPLQQQTTVQPTTYTQD